MQCPMVGPAVRTQSAVEEKVICTQTDHSGSGRARPKRPNNKMPHFTSQPDAARTALLEVFREELALLTDFAELLIAEQAHLFPTASEYEQARSKQLRKLVKKPPKPDKIKTSPQWCRFLRRTSTNYRTLTICCWSTLASFSALPS